jgi:hypothetical protein
MTKLELLESKRLEHAAGQFTAVDAEALHEIIGDLYGHIHGTILSEASAEGTCPVPPRERDYNLFAIAAAIWSAVVLLPKWARYLPSLPIR